MNKKKIFKILTSIVIILTLSSSYYLFPQVKWDYDSEEEKQRPGWEDPKISKVKVALKKALDAYQKKKLNLPKCVRDSFDLMLSYPPARGENIVFIIKQHSSPKSTKTVKVLAEKIDKEYWRLADLKDERKWNYQTTSGKIDIFPEAFTTDVPLEGTIFHELMHMACFEGEKYGEKLAYGCTPLIIEGETGNTGDCSEENCKREKKEKDREDGERREPHPAGERPDDNESVASPIYSDTPITFSFLSNALVLLNGFYAECEKLLESYSILTNLFELPESPEALRDVSDVMVIPTGGLYGMENSEIFKAVLEEYVRSGGIIIVFTQQHGYEFSVLPTPDGEPIIAYGWREDQSCSSNSMYVDTWHPALSSTTRTLISNPVDGYFSGYPSDSTVILRRRVNGMPAMLAYPYGEGWVVATSLFTDWVAFFQDKKIIRNLITWAKNPDLEIQEYDLRDNPNPEVVLNLEIKNISDESASKAKILWLDPDRNVYFEEEELVSVPDAGNNYS